MKYLLDTAPLLYLLQGDESRISSSLRKIIKSKENDLWLSCASLWEIAIKSSIGKLHLSKAAQQLIPPLLDRLDIQTLPVRMEDALGVERLPFHHRDPFDRLIVMQAKNENLAIITPDKIIKKYEVKVVW